MTKTKGIPVKTLSKDADEGEYYCGESLLEAKYLQAYNAQQLAWDMETLRLLDAGPEKNKTGAKQS